jgi:hypothetical protein
MKKILFLSIAVLSTAAAFAQMDPGINPDYYATPGTGVPIDGGVSLLVVAGLGYGAKKIRDARKSREEKEK